MDAVILFSHGSLLCGSGVALDAHAARLQAQGLAPLVAVGYLNYTAPPFAETVDRCIEQGATRIIVTPYFLIPGKFVQVDLPRAVEAAQQAHPGVTFVIAEAIGYDERLADALIAAAEAANGPERWRDSLKNAQAHCRPDPQCPLYGTPDCPKMPAV